MLTSLFIIVFSNNVKVFEKEKNHYFYVASARGQRTPSSMELRQGHVNII